MQKIADLAISRAYNPPELHLIKVIVCPWSLSKSLLCFARPLNHVSTSSCGPLLKPRPQSNAEYPNDSQNLRRGSTDLPSAPSPGNIRTGCPSPITGCEWGGLLYVIETQMQYAKAQLQEVLKGYAWQGKRVNEPWKLWFHITKSAVSRQILKVA